VEPRLRAWELAHALKQGHPEFRFDFEDAETIDRDPPPPREPGSPQVVEIGLASEINVAGSLGVKVTRAAYPEPPTDFAVDPDVETLSQRWQGYLAEREPLQAMAYFCLTLFELRGGGRRGAGRGLRTGIREVASGARAAALAVLVPRSVESDRNPESAKPGFSAPVSDHPASQLELAAEPRLAEAVPDLETSPHRIGLVRNRLDGCRQLVRNERKKRADARGARGSQRPG
jgi:hypothetical protein